MLPTRSFGRYLGPYLFAVRNLHRGDEQVGDPQEPAEWPDDDDIDWVRLYVQAPNLWYSYLTDLGRRPEPVALARFVERCVRSLRCLTDVHARLPDIGLTLAGFVALREEARDAQFAATAHEERPVADDETQPERLTARRGGWRPDLNDALAPEMRAAIVNLHLRGLEDDRIACALDIPADWPEKIISRTRLQTAAQAVVRAHLDGKSLAGIHKATGVPPSTALRILRRIGEKPNGSGPRVDARDRARTIVKLRSRGLTYKEIAERVGCDLDDVKNALRRDRRHRYGEPRASE